MAQHCFCTFVIILHMLAYSFAYSHWIYYTLMTLYAITVLVTLGLIVSENRNPVKTLAWVTVLLLMPGVGLVLYVFFGRSIKNTRMVTRRQRRRLKRGERARALNLNATGIDARNISQVRMARAMTGTLLYAGSNAEIFTSGADKFEVLLRELEGAKRYINLQYYIIADDNIGRRLAEVLCRKARQGVKVRVIYDHVGSFRTPRRFFANMRKAGVEAYPFFRVTFPGLGTRMNWRNHRKLCIIDGQTAWVGGMNVADRYLDPQRWRDTHLRITGPAVAGVQYSFAVDWSFMGRELIEEPESPAQNKPTGNMHMQLVTSGPTSQWSNVAMMMHRAIAGARERIFIQTPYFLPTEGLLRALQTAALARVDVRIMLPRHTDSWLLQFASRSFLADCMRAGIKIYFYNPGMLHAKTLVVDQELCSVGSTNFDFRSFEYNFESNMFIYSRQMNEQMSEIFLNDQTHCTRVDPRLWRRRPVSAKILESTLRLLSPIL